MLDFDGRSKLIFEPPEFNKFTQAWVATAIIGSAAVGAAATAYSASQASSAQQSAAASAAATSAAAQKQAQTNFDTTRSDLQPYRDLGATASQDLTQQLPFLTSPITMDEATLQNTPGYQFNLTQGLKSVQNSAAARGLGTSGAALKGAATFATGLADSTYQNQFNNENTNRTNAYNRLSGLVNTGENAGAQTGVIGQQAASTGVAAAGQQASAIISGGNAAAAGINQTAAGLIGATNNIGSYYAYKGLYGSGGGGNPIPVTGAASGSAG